MEKKEFYSNVINFVQMFGAEQMNTTGDQNWTLSIRTEEPVYLKAIADNLMFTERKIAELTHKYLERRPDDKSKVMEVWTSPIDDFNEGFLPDGIIGINISLPGQEYDRIMGRGSMANPKLTNGDNVTAYPRNIKIAVFGTKCKPHPSKK